MTSDPIRFWCVNTKQNYSFNMKKKIWNVKRKIIKESREPKKSLITWRHISQVVLPFSLHHLCMQFLCANWAKFWKNETKIDVKAYSETPNTTHKSKTLFACTLTVPEHAQGASMLSQLPNSSSWQILQTKIAEQDFKSKSSTYNITSPILSQPFLCFQKFLFISKSARLCVRLCLVLSLSAWKTGL